MTEHTTSLRSLADRRTVLLTTFRRDGTPVGTPVSVALDGDRVVFRTWDTAGKARRLRRNPQVEVAPSTWNGRPTGPSVPARVRQLEGDESRRAARALARKHPLLHGVIVPLTHRLRRNRTVHYELQPHEDRGLEPAEGTDDRPRAARAPASARNGRRASPAYTGSSGAPL